MLEYAVVLISLTAILLYLYTRIFIAGESVISLRDVPIGVHEGGLAWSKHIQHV